MFTSMVNLLPGQELREFDVYSPNPSQTPSGRVMTNSCETKIGSVCAILASAKPEEKERFRQLQHPVTHKIIQRGTAGFDVSPGDFFTRNGQRYFIQTAPYNVGDIGHWTIYYCDERSDV